jgi:hypothetical protein
MEVANTLTYYDMATITAVKSFIVQAPGSKMFNKIGYKNAEWVLINLKNCFKRY